MPKLTDEQFAFIKYITSLNTENNRGTLAVLRRGLSGKPVEDLNLYRFIANKVPDAARGNKNESIYYMISALYGLHPESTVVGNFGAHLKLAAEKRKDKEAAEKRFTILLNAPLDDLAKPLRQAVMILKQPEIKIPVNWVELFSDLLRWDYPQKIVQRAWANSFWGYIHPEETETTTQPADNQ